MKRFARLGDVLRDAFVVAILWTCVPFTATAQTPSPLQEWQYSGGTVLYKMFKPDQPDWRIETGAALEPRPLYEGANTYRLLVGPVIDVHYRDIAFASVGEGLGYNFIRGINYRVGASLGYDMGRRAGEDLENLKGMGNITAAPVVKLFATYAISKKIPLVFRADVRQFVGGANGLVGDVGAYIPLPGSSERLVLFAGPSVTLADRLYTQTEFGVSPNQALASGHPNYLANGGLVSAGLGFNGTYFMTKKWLLNMELSGNRLFGSAGASPITQTRGQAVYALSVVYTWGTL